MDADRIVIEQFVGKHSKEAAAALKKFEAHELLIFFENTSVDVQLALVPELNKQVLLELIGLMEEKQTIELFESMDLSHAEILIRMMPESESDSLLSKLSADKSILLKRLLKYHKKSVGSYMDQTVFTLSENLSVEEALTQARKHKSRLDPTLYVLNTERQVVGAIKLSDLIAEHPKKEIRSIMQSHINPIDPETPVKSVLNHVGWQDQYVLPVVNNSQVLLGVISLAKIRALQPKTDQIREDKGLDTIAALGDLYQIGLAGLIRVATDLKTES